MTDLRTAAQQALEAMEKATRFMSDKDYRKLNESIDVLKAALAEPVQEPVAWKQGNLVTFNEDPCPVLGGLFVQFWDGEEVAARVYANDLKTLRQRCAKVNTAPPQRKQAEPLNLADPAVRKRLAAQWGYVPAAAQAEPVEPVAWMFELARNFNLEGYGGWEKRITEYRPNTPEGSVRNVTPLYTAPPQRRPLTEKEMYIVEEEARKNFRLAQAGPRGQMITYWDSLTPWLIRAVERAHGIKE